MADEPTKIEVTVDGCVLWLLLFAIMPLTGGLYAIADAIGKLVKP